MGRVTVQSSPSKKIANRAAVEPLEGRELMSVSGLQAQYFDWSNFKQLKVERTDAQINFNWRFTGPDEALAKNKFSVRWQGQVAAPTDGLYRFHVTANDNVRLWVDGEQVVDAWDKAGYHSETGAIFLKAGQKYDLRMDYREVRNQAHAKLEWTPPGGERQVVPTAALTSDEPTVTNPKPVGNAVKHVQSFTLINANTDQAVTGYEVMADKSTLNVTLLPTHRLNVRANVSAAVEQVKYTLNGQVVRTETSAPFALGADDGKGNYYSWTPAAGSYTLTATPYTTVGGSLVAGAATTLHFNVVAS